MTKEEALAKIKELEKFIRTFEIQKGSVWAKRSSGKNVLVICVEENKVGFIKHGSRVMLSQWGIEDRFEYIEFQNEPKEKFYNNYKLISNNKAYYDDIVYILKCL